MMLGPLSSKVNNCCLLSAGSGETKSPHSDPDSGQCAMKTNTRFVVKPESGQ